MADLVSGAAMRRRQRRLLVVATRAVDRCGPGHVATPVSPTGTEEGQGGRRGSRGALRGDDPGDSSSPGARHPVLCDGR